MLLPQETHTVEVEFVPQQPGVCVCVCVCDVGRCGLWVVGVLVMCVCVCVCVEGGVVNFGGCVVCEYAFLRANMNVQGAAGVG